MSSPSSLPIKNVSLVAFYYHKPSSLIELIDELQTCLNQTSILKEKFQDYQIEQVHGTILRCEGIRTKQGIINKCFLKNRQEIKYIDLEGLSQYFQSSDLFPLTFRFGGYHPHLDYKFLSRNQHPCTRSFQLQLSTKKTTIAILIGWPFNQDYISLDLEDLRRNAQRFNFLHKHHSLPQTIDNDFYLRLGIFQEPLKPEELYLVQKKIGKILQTKPPIYISLEKQDLAFVKYQDPSLPLETTQITYLSEVTRDKLAQLFNS